MNFRKIDLLKLVLCFMWSTSALAAEFCVGLEHNGGDGDTYYKLHCNGLEDENLDSKEDVLELAKRNGLSFVKSTFQDSVLVFSLEELNDIGGMCVTASHQVDTVGKIFQSLGVAESKYTTHKRTDCGKGVMLSFQNLEAYENYKAEFTHSKEMTLGREGLMQNMVFRSQLSSENESFEFLY